MTHAEISRVFPKTECKKGTSERGHQGTFCMTSLKEFQAFAAEMGETLAATVTWILHQEIFSDLEICLHPLTCAFQ